MEQMTIEEKTKAQASYFCQLLGFMDAHMEMNIPITVASIVRKFKDIDNQGLLPESLKHYIL